MSRGKPFQKGKSGNPSGRPKKDPLLQALKETTYKDFLAGLQKYGTLSREEIQKELMRPEASMFELMFGQIVASAAKGDKDARQVLLERLWGKVKETVDIHQDPERDKLRGMSNAELRTLVQGIIEDREKEE